MPIDFSYVYPNFIVGLAGLIGFNEIAYLLLCHSVQHG